MVKTKMAAYTHGLKMFLNRIRLRVYSPTGNIFEDRLRLHQLKKNAAKLGNPPGCITVEEMIRKLEESIAAQKIQKQWRASYYNPDYAIGFKRAVTACERLGF